MLLAIILGVVIVVGSAVLYWPHNRGVIRTLTALVVAAEQENPALYATKIAPISPLASGTFDVKRIAGMLRADLSGFSEGCLQLQREAIVHDRKAHLLGIPMMIYFGGLGLWWLLR